MKSKTKTFENIGALEDHLADEMGEEGFHRGVDEKWFPPIPTGLISVDTVTGGGFPRGKITEVYGPPSSSKSLLLLSAIGNAQRAGGIAVYIDLERSFDAVWAARNGVNVEELRIVKPTTGEQAYDILLQYLRTKEVTIIGVDSIAQVVPAGELAGEMSDANIGLAARLNAKAMRKITNELGDTAVVLINQTRQNVTTGPFHGNPETTSGGRAIPFYASLRLNVRRIGHVTVGEERTGGVFRCKIEKTKVRGARLYAIATFEVDLVSGLDIAKDTLLHALAGKLIQKSGSWYVFDPETKFQGEHAAKKHLIESGLLVQLRERLLVDAANYIRQDTESGDD